MPTRTIRVAAAALAVACVTAMHGGAMKGSAMHGDAMKPSPKKT